MPVPPTSTLQTIQTKVRRLTRSPSQAQLTDTDLQQYINTFVVYDFPEHLRMFNLLTNFTFYTNIGQDAYPTDTASFAGATNNILYDFQNTYLSVEQPVFIAGFNSLYSQSREQFYGIYPLTNSIASIGTSGNGTTGPFTGFVNSNQAIITPGLNQQVSLLQNNVLFSATGLAGTGATLSTSLVDVPIVDPVSGFKTDFGNLYDPNSAAYQEALANPPTTLADPNNFIHYLSGQFSINFSLPTVVGTPINSDTVPQIQSLPQALLYFDNTFYVRPVPDQAYAVNFQAYVRPTALLATSENPQLNEWWQYIAYGAAKKIFEDRMDLDSVALILPEYRKQETLCLRRTIVQNTTQRTATIYTEQTSMTQNSGWGWGSGNF